MAQEEGLKDNLLHLRSAITGGRAGAFARCWYFFDSQGDFANPIEPSGPGGAKLAGTVIDLVARHDFDMQRAAIYGDAPEG